MPRSIRKFRSEFSTSWLNRTRKQTESLPALKKKKKREVNVAYGFFRIVVSVISLSEKKKTQAGFPVVGWCMINTVSQNHVQIRNMERGMANLPLWQHLGWPSSYGMPFFIKKNTICDLSRIWIRDRIMNGYWVEKRHFSTLYFRLFRVDLNVSRTLPGTRYLHVLHIAGSHIHFAVNHFSRHRIQLVNGQAGCYPFYLHRGGVLEIRTL